jgi:hypothetical protein
MNEEIAIYPEYWSKERTKLTQIIAEIDDNDWEFKYQRVLYNQKVLDDMSTNLTRPYSIMQCNNLSNQNYPRTKNIK